MARTDQLPHPTLGDPTHNDAGLYRRDEIDSLVARMMRKVGVEPGLADAIAAERASLGRALHDGLIQSLISAEMQVYAARQRVSRKSKVVAAELMGIEKLLHQEVLSVRDLMQRIKPIRLEPEELVDYLADHVQKFAADTGMSARFFAKVRRLSLSASMCTEIARLVQEALSNVRKHSGARNVSVHLKEIANSWSIVIEDDGKGLAVIRVGTDLERVRGARTSSGPSRADAGWTSLRHPSPTVIKECVRSLNGDLKLQSTAAGGLRLVITFPGHGTAAAQQRQKARNRMAKVLPSQRVTGALNRRFGVKPVSTDHSIAGSDACGVRR